MVLRGGGHSFLGKASYNISDIDKRFSVSYFSCFSLSTMLEKSWKVKCRVLYDVIHCDVIVRYLLSILMSK